MAAQAFRGVGVDAYSMAGGMERWQAEQRPIGPEGETALGADGRPASVARGVGGVGDLH